MPEHRDARKLWVAGGLGLAGLAAAGVILAGQLGRRGPAPAGPTATATEAAARPATLADDATLEQIAAAIERGDGLALALAQKRLLVAEGRPVPPLAEADGPGWKAVLTALARHVGKYASYGRATALNVATQVRARYAVEPAPADWPDLLVPSFDLATACLADADPAVRAAAVQTVVGCWHWTPARELLTSQVEALGDWKEALHGRVVKALKDPEPAVRGTAVTALAGLPLDAKSEPAAALVADPAADVRVRALLGFADRPGLLSEEAILPLLFDPVSRVAREAEQVLRRRGLSDAQIELGRMVVHPMPHVRATVPGMLAARDDVDPTVWLLFLSRDGDATVRAAAAAGLAQMADRPEAATRLAELASDPDPKVQQAAGAESTAALPPLPAERLAPRAN